MEPISLNKIQTRIKMRITCFIAVFIALQLSAHSQAYIVDSSMNLADGMATLFKNIQPGDTVYLKAGTRDKLLIRNFSGSAEKPIIFINKDGVTNFNTSSYYGVSILNCRYIKFTGTGDPNNQYGIRIERVSNGAGLGIGGMSTDFEIDHISITNCSTEGIIAKTDPDCSFMATREQFTQFNTSIHDNYISDVKDEGMYIGSSYYSGVKLNCNGKDTVVMPAILDHVAVYNNIVNNTGWDGIQVSSAPLHCQVHHNTITHDSQAETKNQMSGILLGGGSKCDCYNNKIADGKGDGIEDHGLGGNKIFNNIIVNAGRSFQPNDATQAKHGIFVSDVSVSKDSSFNILFNDIINPKSDGIRFQTIKSKNSLIASNLIINPGSYDVYQYGNTSFKGNDAYIMIPNQTSSVQLKNNFLTRNINDAGISANDFSLLPGSPLINKGYQQASFINFDFKNEKRPIGGYFDIGAMEYNSGDDRLTGTVSKAVSLFPNPVQSKLNLRYEADGTAANNFLRIYSFNGQLVLEQAVPVITAGIQQLEINTDKLMKGFYLYSLHRGSDISYGRFVKL